MKSIKIEIELTDDLLNDIADFLVDSEDTATENAKTDFFFEAESKKDIKLRNWTKELVNSMIHLDDHMRFLINNEDTIVDALLKNKEIKANLKSEFESLYDECKEDLDF